MSLTVTRDSIRDLAEHVEQTQRPDETGIILTNDGWEIHVRPGGLPGGLTAVTGDDIYAYMDEEGYSDDIADMILDHEGGSTYTILDENGDLEPPADGVNWQVVTCIRDKNGDETPDHGDAYWFDKDAATLVIDEKTSALREHGRSWELWRTKGGRFLLRQHSNSVTDPSESWTEISVLDAATLGYQAPADLLADNPPLAVQAARLATALVDLLTPPRGLDAGPAAEYVHAAGAVGTLLRNQVLSDIRDGRATAASDVVRDLRSNARAAGFLGMHESTLSNLLKD